MTSPHARRPHGGQVGIPAPSQPGDPRHRTSAQAVASGLLEDQDAFTSTRGGKRTLRLDRTSPLRLTREGLGLAVGRYLTQGRDGSLTLDVAGLLGHVFQIASDGRMTLRLGAGLEITAQGALRPRAAAIVPDLTDSTGGTPSDTLAAVSGTGDDGTINDGLASLAAQILEIKTALAANGNGVGS